MRRVSEEKCAAMTSYRWLHDFAHGQAAVATPCRTFTRPAAGDARHRVDHAHDAVKDGHGDRRGYDHSVGSVVHSRKVVWWARITSAANHLGQSRSDRVAITVDSARQGRLADTVALCDSGWLDARSIECLDGSVQLTLHERSCLRVHWQHQSERHGLQHLDAIGQLVDVLRIDRQIVAVVGRCIVIVTVGGRGRVQLLA